MGPTARVTYLDSFVSSKISKGSRYSCLDVTSSYAVVGTDSGCAFLFHRNSGFVQKLHCDISPQSLTCIRCLESVDLLIAIGSTTGIILVFQFLPATNQMERYLIPDVHKKAISCLEWNQNGVKLFSGDESGIVAFTEMDYLMHLSKSLILYQEPHPIVQIEYYMRRLLISTKFRTFIANVSNESTVTQVGIKERKTLGNFGAVFIVPFDSLRNENDVLVFASRPSLRLWKANCEGKVLETFIFKDNSTPSCQVIHLGGKYMAVGLLSPRSDLEFGQLKLFKGKYLLTWSYNRLMLLSVTEPSMVAKCDEFEDIRSVCSTGDEMFVLDGFRRITRIACSPDKVYVTDVSKDAFKFMPNPFKALETTVMNRILPKTFHSSNNNEVEDKVLNLESKSETSSALNLQFVMNDVNDNGDNPVPNTLWPSLPDNADDDDDRSVPLVYKRLPAISKNKQRDQVIIKITPEIPETGIPTPNLELPQARLKGDISAAEVSPLATGSREDKERILAEIFNISELAPAAQFNHSRPTTPVVNELPASHSVLDEVAKFTDNPFASSGDEEVDVVKESGSLLSNVDYPDIYNRSNPSIESYLSYGPPSGSSNMQSASLPEPSSFNPGYLPCSQADIIIENKVEMPEQIYTTVNVSEQPLKAQQKELSPPKSLESTSQSPTPSTVSQSSDRSRSSSLGSPTASYNDTWLQHKPPGQIQSLAVCDTYMVCTATKDVVYYSLFEGLGLEWHKTEYPAKQISVSPSGKRVWRIHDHSAYALFEPSVRGPFGIRWMEVALDVQQISVHESCVWYVTCSGEVYCQTGLQLDQTFVAVTHVPCPSKVASISCNSSAVLALTMGGELLWRTDIDEENSSGKHWLPLKLDRGLIFAATLGNSVVISWIIDEAFDIWFLVSTKSKSKSPKTVYKWWQVKISDYIFQNPSPLHHITSTLMDSLCAEQLTQMLGRINTGNACLVCTDNKGIWFYNPSDHRLLTNQREIVGHSWEDISIGKITGVKWKVFTASGVYHHHGGIWLWSKKEPDIMCLNPTTMTVSSVKPPALDDGDKINYLNAAPEAVWLLTKAGRIFIRKDITANNVFGSKWVELDLTQITNHRLVHVCCGSNLVWAVDCKGVVLMRIGSLQVPSIRNFPPAWVVVDEEGNNPKIVFTEVYVGPLDYTVWAIDNKYNVYVREGIFPEILIGVGWVLVSGIQAISLAISEKAVYALTPSSSIYRRYNISRNNYIGDYWKELPGKAKQISVTVDDKLWALGLDNQLIRHSTCQVAGGCKQKISKVDENVSIEDDWEVV
ncbi:Tectonin beta-propeller repeat containing 2, variant 3 [Chamberlinius hualienensis]